MGFRILNDRAQKYGRNVTIAARVILVLAWAPGIDIDSFKPLGFEFKPGSKGKLSTWCLLLGVLVYYYSGFALMRGLTIWEALIRDEYIGRIGRVQRKTFEILDRRAMAIA